MTPARTAAALFVIWCIAGAALFRDYAVSWDEPAGRGSGVCSNAVLHEHIAGREVPRQYYELWGGDRFYGLIFQHILHPAEKVYTGEESDFYRYAGNNTLVMLPESNRRHIRILNPEEKN